MKIYSDEKMQVKKSWCLKLCESSDRDIYICAVDSETGKGITNLISFLSDGRIVRDFQSFDILGEMGYDPYEHNNSFDHNGSIVIDDE